MRCCCFLRDRQARQTEEECAARAAVFFGFSFLFFFFSYHSLFVLHWTMRNRMRRTCFRNLRAFVRVRITRAITVMPLSTRRTRPTS